LRRAVEINKIVSDCGKKMSVTGEATRRRDGKRERRSLTPRCLTSHDVPNKQMMKERRLVSCPK